MNPMLIRGYRKSLSLRNTKTDKADAKAIADYGIDRAASLPEGKTVTDTESRIIARRRASNADDTGKAKTILKQDVAVAFPELLSLNLFTGGMLHFLTLFGSAREVMAASDDALEQALRPTGRGMKVALTVKELRRLSKDSVGVSLHGLCVRDSAKRVLECVERNRMLTDALLESEKAVHPKDVAIVSSMPGIGEVEAAQFLAEVGDIRRFPTYQKLIAYMGTDPGVCQSGQSNARGHISKHGDAVLRKYVFLMAKGSIIRNPVFGDYYRKKRSQTVTINGGNVKRPYRKAMVDTMNKLVRVLHFMLTHDVLYAPEKTN
jgi:transposase